MSVHLVRMEGAVAGARPWGRTTWDVVAEVEEEEDAWEVRGPLARVGPVSVRSAGTSRHTLPGSPAWT